MPRDCRPGSLLRVPAEDRASPGLSSLPRAPALTDVQPHTGGTNRLAVAAFVCGLVGCTGLGMLLAVAFGHVALVQIRRYGQEGKGLAITGLVAGYLSLTFWALTIVAVRSSGS